MNRCRGRLAACFFVVTLVPLLASQEAEPGRVKQIADLEKQIQELQSKLKQLKDTPAAATPDKSGGMSIDWAKMLAWRSIGPANMGGRITSLAVVESDPSAYYVATASGGLLKTINNGSTFEHRFDHEKVVSLGAIAVAPSDRKIVWAGTGEANPR